MRTLNPQPTPITTTARRWYGPDDAAEYLDVSPRTLRRMVADGRLPAYRMTGSRMVRFDVRDLEGILHRIPAATSEDRAAAGRGAA